MVLIFSKKKLTLKTELESEVPLQILAISDFSMDFNMNNFIRTRFWIGLWKMCLNSSNKSVTGDCCFVGIFYRETVFLFCKDITSKTLSFGPKTYYLQRSVQVILIAYRLTFICRNF